MIRAIESSNKTGIGSFLIMVKRKIREKTFFLLPM